MRIAFDAQPLLYANKTGIAYCEEQLTHAYMKLFAKDEYALDVFSVNKEIEKDNLEQFYVNGVVINKTHFPRKLYRVLNLLRLCPHRFLFRNSRDITHFFNFYIPFGVHGKKVVTIHDMAFKAYPETVYWKTKLMLNLSMRATIKRADHIVTVSEFSKKEIMKYYGLSEDKVSVVRNGVNLNRFHSNYTESEKIEIREKYALPKDYILYLGTLEPRKNIKNLLLAYRSVRKQDKTFPTLVIAGGKGWLYNEIFETIKVFDLEQSVLFTGYVDEADVAPLLCQAQIFCFPSLYEGFGMPVLEAMACGVPVLTSNNSSLDEIAKDAALKVNPEDTHDIAEGLFRLWKDKELCKQMVVYGKIRAHEYTWDKAATELNMVYQKL